MHFSLGRNNTPNLQRGESTFQVQRLVQTTEYKEYSRKAIKGDDAKMASGMLKIQPCL